MFFFQEKLFLKPNYLLAVRNRSWYLLELYINIDLCLVVVMHLIGNVFFQGWMWFLKLLVSNIDSVTMPPPEIKHESGSGWPCVAPLGGYWYIWKLIIYRMEGLLFKISNVNILGDGQCDNFFEFYLILFAKPKMRYLKAGIQSEFKLHNLILLQAKY